MLSHPTLPEKERINNIIDILKQIVPNNYLMTQCACCKKEINCIIHPILSGFACSTISTNNVLNLELNENLCIKEYQNDDKIKNYLNEIKNIITGNNCFYYKELIVETLKDFAYKEWNIDEMIDIISTWNEDKRNILFTLIDELIQKERKLQNNIYNLKFINNNTYAIINGDVPIRQIKFNDKYSYAYLDDGINKEIFVKPSDISDSIKKNIKYYDPYHRTHPDIPELPENLKISDYLCLTCIKNYRNKGQLLIYDEYTLRQYPRANVNYVECCYCENIYLGNVELYYDRGYPLHYDCNEVMCFGLKKHVNLSENIIYINSGSIEGFGHFDQMCIFPVKGSKIKRKIQRNIIKKSLYEKSGYYNYKDKTQIPYCKTLKEAIKNNYPDCDLIENFIFTSFQELGDYLGIDNLNEDSLFCLSCMELLLKNKLFLAVFDDNWL